MCRNRYRVSTLAGKAGNEPFSEFGGKSSKTIGFSPALAGQAGILFLSLVIMNSIVR